MAASTGSPLTVCVFASRSKASTMASRQHDRRIYPIACPPSMSLTVMLPLSPAACEREAIMSLPNSSGTKWSFLALTTATWRHRWLAREGGQSCRQVDTLPSPSQACKRSLADCSSEPISSARVAQSMPSLNAPLLHARMLSPPKQGTQAMGNLQMIAPTTAAIPPPNERPVTPSPTWGQHSSSSSRRKKLIKAQHSLPTPSHQSRMSAACFMKKRS
mmetsp:Transcript_36348/g.90774  ORF Transcript_36348/g.90774 Transcript_36348/m.90774 type:complete len:217 (+) Transcript_36348:50-700(+)